MCVHVCVHVYVLQSLVIGIGFICVRGYCGVQVHASACVCVYLCMKTVPGCSLIHSDIISYQKQAFSRIFGTRMMDGPTDG